MMVFKQFEDQPNIFVQVITQARVLWLIYTHDAPKGECVCIRQSTSACVITDVCHSLHSKNTPKPDADCLATL